MSDGETIRIASTRDPDGEPVCELAWGQKHWYAPVADVRRTALDLVTCAAYAEMMREMILKAGIPPSTVEAFATSLLRGVGRRQSQPWSGGGFGAATTMDLIPASGIHKPTGERLACVLLACSGMDGMLTADEAREMAGIWLATAEATESDQLVAEAYRATHRGNDAGLTTLFGYLRKLRGRTDQPPGGGPAAGV